MRVHFRPRGDPLPLVPFHHAGSEARATPNGSCQDDVVGIEQDLQCFVSQPALHRAAVQRE